MEVIDKTFKLHGLESTYINGIVSGITLCYRVYANLVAMPVKGFACIFTDVSGEIVVDMGVNSCLQINAVDTTTYEHVPVFEAPRNMAFFTIVNHLENEILDEEESVWIHNFSVLYDRPLEFVFHLEIPEYWLQRHEQLRIRLKLI